MGNSFLADIPGNFFISPMGTHASVASNGATADFTPIFVAPAECQVSSVWWSPDAAANTAAQTASYRRLSLLDGGADASGTAVLGSYNINGTVAALGTVAFTLAGTPTVDAGDQMYVRQVTVGGNHNDGTVLPAGRYWVAYQLL